MELYEILNLVDSGQLLKPDKFEGDFPMRGSALAKCAREMGHLMRGVPRNDVSPRQKRTFEVGHQRGEALGEALDLALRLQYPDTPDQTVEWYEEYRCAIPTSITGEAAHRIFYRALHQVGGNEEKVPMSVDITVGTRSREHDRLYILGSIDFLILDHKERLIWVLDWKTKHSFGFKKLNDEGVDLGYAVQVGAYSRALADKYPNYTIRAAVYYEDKNDHKHRPIEVDLEDLDCGHVDQYLIRNERLLIEWFEGADVRPPDYEPNERGSLPWQCNYCSVGPERGECFKDVFDARSSGKDVPSWKVPV